MNLDLKKVLKDLYDTKKTEPYFVTAPKLKIISCCGYGNPNNSVLFQKTMSALYSITYTIKFMLKQTDNPLYTVMPLEGLWWTDEMSTFSLEKKEEWKWKVFIVQPDFITREIFDCGIKELLKKKKEDVDTSLLSFDSFEEGLCAQILHIGPYAQEEPTVKKLHEFINHEGYKMTGLHHEVYMGDPRKAAPEKLKTLIRQPVRKI